MALRSESEQSFPAAVDLATQANFQRHGEIGLYPLGQTSTYARDKTLYQDIHVSGGDALSWMAGAEGLLGDGDFLAVLGGHVVRFQAASLSREEVALTAQTLRTQWEEQVSGENRVGSRQPGQEARSPLGNAGRFAPRQRGPLRWLKTGTGN